MNPYILFTLGMISGASMVGAYVLYKYFKNMANL